MLTCCHSINRGDGKSRADRSRGLTSARGSKGHPARTASPIRPRYLPDSRLVGLAARWRALLVVCRRAEACRRAQLSSPETATKPRRRPVCPYASKMHHSDILQGVRMMLILLAVVRSQASVSVPSPNPTTRIPRYRDRASRGPSKSFRILRTPLCLVALRDEMTGKVEMHFCG
jgi:hypothetical protein